MDIGESFENVYDDSYERDLPDELIENYNIVECLSHAEQCDTLLVMQKTTEKRLVAKCYTNISAMYEQTEFMSFDNAESPSVPRIIAEYKNERYHCVLREYIEGVTLDEVVKSNNMSVDDMMDIAIKLAVIMKEIHELEPAVIHRDIKPQNIIVKEDGSLALIDFGISRIYKSGMENDTLIGGTAAFASPEQYGFMQTDIRSDMYSYGVVLAWMLTGKEKPIKKPVSALERVAARCCAFSPDKRYKNDDALIRALQRAIPEHQKKVKIRMINAVLTCLMLAIGAFAGISLYRYSMRDRMVTFREPLIEEAVRQFLDKKYGDVTYKELQAITKIYIYKDRIFTTTDEWFQYSNEWYQDGAVRGTLTDISDLENMPNLEKVYIGGEHIVDLTPLKKLDLLEELDLRGNDVEDISPLADKIHLTSISFNDNRLNNIDVLTTCPELSRVDLHEAGKFDGSPIADMAQMSFLDICCDSDAYLYIGERSFDILKLGAPGQTDLECIRNVRSITNLYIYWSEISDISALEGRDDIIYLNMRGCPIEDLSPLFSMTALREVELDSNMRKSMEELTSVYGEPGFEIVYIE